MTHEYDPRIADLAALYDLDESEIEALCRLSDSLPETVDDLDLRRCAEGMALMHTYQGSV